MTPAKQDRSRQTAERIVAAALDLLGDRSFDQMKVTEIAARAGISVGGFYARFSSKDAVIDYLNAREGVSICGIDKPQPERLPTISFSVEGYQSSQIPPICDAEGVGIRWGHFYAPRLVEALGLTERDGVVRVSMVHYNTEDEVRRLTDVLDRAW